MARKVLESRLESWHAAVNRRKCLQVHLSAHGMNRSYYESSDPDIDGGNNEEHCKAGCERAWRLAPHGKMMNTAEQFWGGRPKEFSANRISMPTRLHVAGISSSYGTGEAEPEDPAMNELLTDASKAARMAAHKREFGLKSTGETR